MSQPMDPQLIANLFSALRDGEIQSLERNEQDLQFRVFLPKLAARRGEGFLHFLCSLAGISQFVLQPFRNESTEIADLKQITKLKLCIGRADLGPAEWVRVYCAHIGGAKSARLSIKADQFFVWDEAFDPISVAELSILRGMVDSGKKTLD